MQIIAKQKRMAAEQSELEVVEAENDVEAIELAIEVVERKGYIEETFWRFPHLAVQIFEELDTISLSKCLEINKRWQHTVIERKILHINLIQKHTYIKVSILKKELGNKELEIIQKLASYSMKVYQKVIIDGMNSNGINFEDNDGRKQQEEILRYLFEKKHRDNIQQLLTVLMLENTTKLTLREIQPLIRNGDFELLDKMFPEDKETPFQNFMEMCKKVHLRWRNENYSGEFISDAIFALYPELYVVV